MKNNKKINSVKMMRDIRNKLNKEYNSNPELREERLKEIRKKYKIRTRKSLLTKHQTL